MLEPRHATAIADQFELGRPESLEGPVARGEQGQIWRLVTSSGRWAVREPFEPQTEDEVREDADFQAAAHAAGVPTPRAVRTSAGDVIAAVADTQVRVYEWVDLRDPDPGLDPARWARCWRGYTPSSSPVPWPEDPWYTDAIGAHRWDELVDALAAADAPFAGEFASIRDELVALEASSNLQGAAHLPSRPVGGQPAQHRHRGAVRDRLGQLRRRRPVP